jgi:hypothetical protein
MAIDRFEVLFRLTKREFPRFSIKERGKSWVRFLSSGAATTIGSTVYTELDLWNRLTSDQRYKILRQEKVRIRQYNCWPLGRWAWPFNYLLFAFCYFLVLPIFWTFRSKFEREAYAQSLLVDFELGGRISDAEMEENAEWLTDLFASGTPYAWMWRRRAAYQWAMDTQRRINAGEITNPEDRVEEPRAAS